MERLYVISLPQWRHVSGMASRITDCLVNNLFRQTTKYTSKRHIIMIILALYEGNPPVTESVSMSWRHRADSRLVPSQLETSLESNAVSHWLGANLEWALTSSCMIVEFPHGNTMPHQGSLRVWAWPMRDDVILYRRLSLAEHLSRTISALSRLLH